MGGFIPTCHTQTFVEVAKLEIFMIEIPSAIGLLVALYFCRSAKSTKSQHKLEQPIKPDFSPVTKEIKSRHNRGASCSVYRDGTVKAFSFYYGKGGCSISQPEFNSLEFQVNRGGVWEKNIYRIDGSLKEVIDLMPSLDLPSFPPPPPTPAGIPRRDYGFRVY